jgi:photosystem II stability/assembly factor-like uncharacterized protein
MRSRLTGIIGVVTLVILLTVFFVCPAGAVVNEWTSIGPNSNEVAMLAVDPVNPSIIYLMTQLTGVQSGFKSTNGGTSWNPFSMPAASVVGFAIDPANHETLYAGLPRYVYKSTNSGGVWAETYTAPANYFFKIFAVDSLNSNTIYAGTTFSKVVKSLDGGYHWDQANSGITASGVTALVIDPANHSILYVGTYGGMFKSTDSAATWNPINTGLPLSGPTTTAVNAIAINPLNSSTIYAGTASGLYKSINGGASWSAAGTGDPSSAVLAIDPLQPAKVYAGGGGVYRSTNAGETWNAFNTGLTSTAVKTLAIDPLSPDNLYAGTDGGLFKITFQNTGQYFLTYTKNGAGHGVVTSDPPGIDCNGSCASQFDANSQVVLHAAATDSGSFFMGWTGACTNITPDCTITMDGDKGVAARFSLGTEHMVMLQGGPFPFPYYSLQTSYNNAGSGYEIWAMGTEFVEDLNCGEDKSVYLKGGYDSGFNASSGYTTMRGILTVGMGSVTLANLIIN